MCIRDRARVLTGGVRPNGPGYFYPVTVLAEVPDDARVMREEPFGPLAIINPTANLDQAIDRANACLLYTSRCV